MRGEETDSVAKQQWKTFVVSKINCIQFPQISWFMAFRIMFQKTTDSSKQQLENDNLHKYLFKIYNQPQNVLELVSVVAVSFGKNQSEYRKRGTGQESVNQLIWS